MAPVRGMLALKIRKAQHQGNREGAVLHSLVFWLLKQQLRAPQTVFRWAQECHWVLGLSVCTCVCLTHPAVQSMRSTGRNLWPSYRTQRNRTSRQARCINSICSRHFISSELPEAKHWPEKCSGLVCKPCVSIPWRRWNPTTDARYLVLCHLHMEIIIVLSTSQ